MRKTQSRNLAVLRPDVVLSIILLALVAGAVLGPFFLRYSPYQVDFNHIAQRPSALHWLGTDELGRDVLSRIVYGARTSLTVAVTVQLVAIGLGLFVGLISGYATRALDTTLMAIIDAFYAFPGLVFVIVIIAILPPGLFSIVVGLTFVNWQLPARVTRAKVLSLRNEEFVVAARALGASGPRVLFRHILPNAIGPIIVQFVQGAASVVLTEAALSYMGIGLPASYPGWGVMIARGRDYLLTSPHMALFPILALTVMVISLNGVGRALHTRFEPRARYS